MHCPRRTAVGSLMYHCSQQVIPGKACRGRFSARYTHSEHVSVFNLGCTGVPVYEARRTVRPLPILIGQAFSLSHMRLAQFAWPAVNAIHSVRQCPEYEGMILWPPRPTCDPQDERTRAWRPVLHPMCGPRCTFLKSRKQCHYKEISLFCAHTTQ